MNIKENLLELVRYKSFVKEQVRQLIFIRYRRTFFGYFWTLLNPLLMMGVTTIVFSSIYNLNIKEFAIYMFSGMLAFNFFRDSITQSATTYLENENLILRIYVPRFLFPLSRIIFVTLDNFLMFISLSLILFFIGGTNLNTNLIFLPLSYLLLFMFCLGISLIISVFTVFFRDLPHFLSLTLQVLLFTSPVFLKPTLLPSKLNLLFRFNPLSYYIDLFRSPIMESSFPTLQTISICLILSILSVFFGLIYFIKNERSIALKL